MTSYDDNTSQKKISPNHTLCRFFFISVKGLSCLVNRCQNKHFKKITKKKVIKRVKIINFSQVFLPNWEVVFCGSGWKISTHPPFHPIPFPPYQTKENLLLHPSISTPPFQVHNYVGVVYGRMSSNLLLQNCCQGLYRKAIELLKAPPLETDGIVSSSLISLFMFN